MPGPADFTKFVPGFDFLQSMMKTAGQTLPNMGQWIAPTLDPDEIEKRIEQLRTVQFWLEQNAKLLAASIQALEVQRMTLATLKGMNVPLDSMREAFAMKAPARESAPAPAAATAGSDAAPAPPAPRKPRAKPAVKPGSDAPAAPSAPGVDPMQWWGALTQQFAELAANALKDSGTKALMDTGAEAAKAIAGQAIKAAVDLPAKAASTAVKKTVERAAGVAARGNSKR